MEIPVNRLWAVLRKSIGITFLAFQVGMIGYARFVPSRYFCWAPYDSQNDFAIEVVIGGRALSPQGIYQRYRRPQQGTDNRSIQHIIDILRQYEQTYGRNDHARVVMTYRVNGREEKAWQWPPR